jgi:hypothetical protein
MSEAKKEKRGRGFQLFDPAVLAEVGRAGGRAAHREGKAHEFTSEEARAAGRKGGAAMRRKAIERREQERREQEAERADQQKQAGGKGR